jgi:uncharacterized protein YegP (UPF0339 family)
VAEYQLFKDAAGKWRWRLVGGNGEVVAQSEAYADKTRARKGALSAQAAGTEASVGQPDASGEITDVGS